MTTELVIFSAILVVSVILHLFFWLNSKKRYTEYMKRQEALMKRIEQLEESNVEMDRILEDAEGKGKKMNDEIEALRSVWFANKEKKSIGN